MGCNRPVCHIVTATPWPRLASWELSKVMRGETFPRHHFDGTFSDGFPVTSVWHHWPNSIFLLGDACLKCYATGGCAGSSRTGSEGLCWWNSSGREIGMAWQHTLLTVGLWASRFQRTHRPWSYYVRADASAYRAYRLVFSTQHLILFELFYRVLPFSGVLVVEIRLKDDNSGRIQWNYIYCI